MMRIAVRKPRRFPEISYANENQPRLKRWLILSIEELSGRAHYVDLYEFWRDRIAPTRDQVFARMLDLVGIRVRKTGAWPPALTGAEPLVIVANHPYGIGDGIAALSLAEQLGRPFRVMINAELLKIPEMREYALPIDFEETKEALRNNLFIRHEALRLLKEGTTIVVFPAGGVATAPRGFGVAEDLPWKLFPAKMIHDARATVLPVHFAGQNGRIFHIASRFSMTLRTSLLIREFTRLSGRTIDIAVGRPLHWEELAAEDGRQALTSRLYREVFALAPKDRRRRRKSRNDNSVPLPEAA